MQVDIGYFPNSNIMYGKSEKFETPTYIIEIKEPSTETAENTSPPTIAIIKTSIIEIIFIFNIIETYIYKTIPTAKSPQASSSNPSIKTKKRGFKSTTFYIVCNIKSVYKKTTPY